MRCGNKISMCRDVNIDPLIVDSRCINRCRWQCCVRRSRLARHVQTRCSHRHCSHISGAYERSTFTVLHISIIPKSAHHMESSPSCVKRNHRGQDRSLIKGMKTLTDRTQTTCRLTAYQAIRRNSRAPKPPLIKQP
jgi:hypothetical protein